MKKRLTTCNSCDIICRLSAEKDRRNKLLKRFLKKFKKICKKFEKTLDFMNMSVL